MSRKREIHPEPEETGLPTVADHAEIRQEAVGSLEAVNGRLGELRDQLSFFQERDLPAFNYWLETAFSELMTEISGIFDRIAEKRSLIEEVGHEASKRRIGYRDAYDLVIKRRKEKAAGVQGEFWSAEKGEEPGEAQADRAAGGPRASDAEARELFEESIRDAGHDPEELSPEEYAELLGLFRARNGFDDASDRPGGSGRDENAEAESIRRPRERPVNESEAHGLRRLYRQLARALHPDVSERRDAETAQLWLDVQRAYESADLAMLAAIWERLQPGGAAEGSGFGFVTVWDIHQRIHRLLQSARKTERDLKQAKRDRAWGFARPDRTRERRIRKLMPEVRVQLERERDEVQEALDELDGFIEEWLSEGSGRRARRGGRGGDDGAVGSRRGSRGRGRGGRR